MSDVQTILNERQKTHGRWEENARISQGLLRVLRTGSRWPDLTDSQVEALQMISHKLHRIVNGDPNMLDHWDDIAGYATLEANRLRAALKNTVAQSVSGKTTGDVGQNGGVPEKSDVYSLLAEETGLPRRTVKDLCLLVLYEQREEMLLRVDSIREGRGLPQREDFSPLDLYTGPVQDFAASPPPWPHIVRSVVGSLLGAETVYLPDRSRIDPEVVEVQLCRLDGKLPRLDYEALHPALRTLYAKQADGYEYVLLPEFAGWAS